MTDGHWRHRTSGTTIILWKEAMLLHITLTARPGVA